MNKKPIAVSLRVFLWRLASFGTIRGLKSMNRVSICIVSGPMEQNVKIINVCGVVGIVCAALHAQFCAALQTHSLNDREHFFECIYIRCRVITFVVEIS